MSALKSRREMTAYGERTPSETSVKPRRRELPVEASTTQWTRGTRASCAAGRARDTPGMRPRLGRRPSSDAARIYIASRACAASRLPRSSIRRSTERRAVSVTAAHAEPPPSAPRVPLCRGGKSASRSASGSDPSPSSRVATSDSYSVRSSVCSRYT